MKILLDQNLSHRLVPRIREAYGEVVHVRDVGLYEADDLPIWEYAKANGYTVFTRDDDFNDLYLVRGHPPKIVWLKDGNASNRELTQLLLDRYERIRHFIEDDFVDSGLLEVYRYFIIE
jgi:predicted nuclease of predicted toxin-antitoxin system